MCCLLMACGGEDADGVGSTADSDGSTTQGTEAESAAQSPEKESPTLPDGAQPQQSAEPSSMAEAPESEAPGELLDCVFQDPLFEAEVRELLGMSTGAISPAAAATLDVVDVRDVPIESLGGVECLTELEALRVWNAPVVDISPLVGLEHLRLLDVGSLEDSGYPSLTDIEVVRELTSLENLMIAGHAVSDLSPLADHPSLTRLTASRNQIQSVEPLADLSLRQLELSGNSVTDLSPLRGQPIASLYLSSNGISDITALADLPDLEILFLLSNPLHGLTPLSELPLLRSLFLLDSPIDELEALRELESLEVLSAINCGVADLSPLSGLTLLRNLTLADNAVTDLSPLLALPALEDVDLRGNPFDCAAQGAALAELGQLTTANSGELRHDCP